MGMKIILSQTPVPVAQWYSVLNDTYWTANNAGTSWDGSKWIQNTLSSLVIDPTGSWVTDYRPTKMRVTLAAVGRYQIIIDTGIANVGNYVSGAEFDLTFSGSDIVQLKFYSEGAPMQITNIEFYSLEDPTA